MSYDTSVRKKQKPAEQQALLPDVLRTANVTIEGQLTKLQNKLRELIRLKEKIGTQDDNEEHRKNIKKTEKDMKQDLERLQKEIEDYGAISVPYRSQRQQQEKKEAYTRRLNEVDNKYKQETQEISVKQQQHIDIVRRNTLNYQDSAASLHQDDSRQSLLHDQLDAEELKIQGEAAYMEEVIGQRQDELNDVEHLMGDINAIAKDINNKVHDQRADLIEIDQNAGTALENAEEAEKNIEEAQGHQKSGGKCLYWTVGIVAIAVIIIIIIIVVSLV